MKRVVSIIKFLLDCGKAILEGLEKTGESWPTNNPFNNKSATVDSSAKKDEDVNGDKIPGSSG